MDINALIAALPANGGIVDIPAGTFTINAPLVLRQGLTLRGAGMRATTLICDGGGLIAQGARIDGLRIADMSLIGQCMGIGIDMTDVDRSMFERVQVSAFETSVRLVSSIGAYHDIFLGCHVTDGYVLQGTATTEGPNSIRILGGEARRNGGTAIQIDCGNNMLIEGVSIEGTTKIGVDAVGLDDGMHRANVTIIGCRFEHGGMATTAIRIGQHAFECRMFGNFITSDIQTPMDNQGARTLSDIGGTWH